MDMNCGCGVFRRSRFLISLLQSPKRRSIIFLLVKTMVKELRRAVTADPYSRRQTKYHMRRSLGR